MSKILQDNIISGYQIQDQIHSSINTLVYRAIRVANQQPVILKRLRQEYPTAQELTRYRREYAIINSLKQQGVVKAYSLESYQRTLVMVLEDFGGQSLRLWTNNQPLGLEKFLPLGIQITEILGKIHAAHIIHKNINSDNLVFNPTNGVLKIIDFGIATQLNRETPSLKSPNLLEGSLPYISPEQTGRMNRSVDYRSDFYSLGVTFYELLTGQLPFSNQDALELVHCHLAKQPTPPHQINSNIPLSLSQIVMKLIAKKGEDRYQSVGGLQEDLEQCWQQWQTRGSITLFDLGARDWCDRFIIPEKLYGRETEVQLLLDGFERVLEGKSEMILVAGFSGIGKTAVINEVHKPITRCQGYFIEGKFDQFNRNMPFSAFLQAFRGLIRQLLGQSDAELNTWKTKILAALGESGQVIIDVIPELSVIIGQQPPIPELSGSAAQNRFNLIFGRFVRVFTTKEQPLVIFLDDLQWVDSASLNLLKLLMEESEIGHLLLLGAYRDNEVFPAHPLMLSLAELEKNRTLITTITLKPLALNHINQLIAETLSCDLEIAQPLTELVYQKTQGNPFFTTQFLKGLQEDRLIVFDRSLDSWECDLVPVREAALTNDVVEFMVGRLQKLPEATQAVLKLAACIGNQFDLLTLAVVCEASPVEVGGDLWRALSEGFVMPVSETYKFFQGDEQEEMGMEAVTVSYRFLHDRVQQAAYALIPEGQKQVTHLHIGRLLLQNLSLEEQDTNLFTIANHWNQALALITDTSEKKQLVQLNLAAGEKAKGSAAYEAARQYFQTALSLIDSATWQTNYPLALKLHEANAEVAYLTGDFALMETTIEGVLNQARDLLDRVKVHQIKIQAQMAQSHLLEALDTGVQFLELLGLKIPESAQPEELQREIKAIDRAMAEKAIADLAHLPLMEDGTQLAKVNILVNLLSPCYQAKPSLFPLVVCQLMQLSIQYGNTPQSSFIYACYGMICILVLQDFASAREYGQLACQLDLSPQTGDGVGGTYVAGVCLTHYSNHVRETLPLLLKAYQAGLETGNFQFGGYAICNRSQYLYFMGAELSALKLEMKATSHALTSLKQGNTLAWSKTFEQAMLNLLGESASPWLLIGTAYNETQSLPIQIAANNRTELHYVYLHKLILDYLFERIPQARENAALAESYLDGVVCFLHEYICNFYDSLTQLAHYSYAEESGQQSILAKVQTNQVTMERWSTHAPMNGKHKYDLVAAEYHRVLGNKTEAIELYDRAMAGAEANGYIQESALAYELAAKFYLDWGREKIARVYMSDAYYHYSCWGAIAKVKQLEAKYPHLLLQKSTQLGTSKSTLSITSLSQPDSALDLESLMKASQAISSEIVLERLLKTLVQILLENTGAQSGCLILATNGELLIEAAGSVEEEVQVLQSMPLEQIESSQEKLRLSSAIINYVSRTRENLVLSDARHKGNFTQEPYIQTYQVKSVLCVPLLNQTQLSGIVYLENNLITDAFTADRLKILQLLSGQAAIAIDQARLYSSLEQKVTERTQALQNKNQEIAHTLEQLQTTQRQLIESEKMAALGGLVAGVAHEINTPLGTAVISASTLKNYTHSLQNDLVQGNLKRSALQNYLTVATESSQLILSNLHRAGELIQSFKQIAVDQTSLQIRTFALKPYLEEVLVSLTPKLKKTTHQLTVRGDDTLTLHSYPGAISQIVTNLVVNSLTHAYQTDTVGHLSWSITPQEEQIVLYYSDDGCGIPQTNLHRIFEPFFTTARDRGGNGLGLHLVYNLVTQKLQGRITVDSEVGAGTTFTITLPVVIPL